MSSKKNKNAYNPFYFYMIERRPEIERKYRRKVSMNELPGLLHQEWKVLPESMKHRYKAKCSEEKANGEKYDSRGIPLSEIEKAAKLENTKKEEMRKEIMKTVSRLHTENAIENGIFSVISITYYVLLNDGTFVPSEIGISDFSFRKGIYSCYHEILPDKIPFGYKFEALQHSEQTHNLIFQDNDDSNCNVRPPKQQDFNLFKSEFYNFLMKDNKDGIVYTHNEFITSVESMVNSFQLPTNIRIYSLDTLFGHLYSAAVRDIPESVASDMLISSQFDYVSSLACEWHQTVTNDSFKYCALSYTKRWIFNMCLAINLQKTFGVIPMKERHLPPDFSLAGVADNFKNLSINSTGTPPLSSKPLPVASHLKGENESDARMNWHPSISQLQSARSHDCLLRDDGNSSASASKKKVGGPRVSLGLVGFGRGKKATESSDH